MSEIWISRDQNLREGGANDLSSTCTPSGMCTCLFVVSILLSYEPDYSHR